MSAGVSLASGRRGAVSHTVAFAHDLLEGLQRALASGGPQAPAVASNPESRSASRQASPVRAAPPACSAPEQPSQAQQQALVAAAAAPSSQPVVPKPLRLTQRRGAVSHFSSQLRMALRLPLTPTLSPCPSPGPQTPATGPSAAGVTTPSSYPAPAAWCAPHLSVTPAPAPPVRRASAPVSPGLGLQLPRYPSPAPRPAAHSVPAAGIPASGTNNYQHQHQSLVAPQPQHGMVTASPITGPVRRLEITLDPAGMDPLPSPVSVAPLPSATPPIRAPSPRVVMMNSFFTQARASSVTPPPFGAVSPSAQDAAMPSGRATPSQQRASRLRRRRTAVVAHGDFSDSIPEEWRNADEHGENEGAAPQIGPLNEEPRATSPRIRVRRASLSATASSHGRGGIALNARRTLLSVDLDRFVPALSNAHELSSCSNSDVASSTPAGMGNLDAAHTSFFSPSSAHSSVSAGTSSALGTCSAQSLDSTMTPLSANSFTSPSFGAVSLAAPLPPTYRRHSVTGADGASAATGAASSHPRVLEWAAPPLARAASLGSVAEAPFA